MSNTPINKMPIKLRSNSFILSVVHLYDAQPEIIRQVLANKISQAPTFFKYAPVVVNISDLKTNSIDWEDLKKAITDIGLRIVGISGCTNSEMKAEIEQAGLPTLKEGKERSFCSSIKSVETPLASAQNSMRITKSQLIDSPVRSGKRIYARNCDLIVTSHVNAGAELIADGNIHVYGILRGRALAGASGYSEAQIFCTNLTAQLISIAGEYLLSDQIPDEFYGKAARLRLANNTLTVQALN